MSTSDSLSITLPADDEILATRRFAAARHLVFRAWTEPELIRRWWAGDRGLLTSVEVDLRVGGHWRYVVAASGRDEVAFHGEYRELVPDERIVSTEVFEGVPDGAALTTVTFTEAAGLTTVRMLVQHSSAAARDLHLRSGMETGLRSALDHLAQVLSEPTDTWAAHHRRGRHPMTEHLGDDATAPPQPDAALRALDRLVGTWAITGDATGSVTYRWLEGEWFLVQTGELTLNGHHNRFTEIIGRERVFGGEPSADIMARTYTSEGDTLDYVYELAGDTLTIWGGARDSDNLFTGTFSADGSILTGVWSWTGGGYATTSTRQADATP